MREIGARITAVAPSRGSMTLPARPEWVGDPLRGQLHPGALTVLADSACGLAVGAALKERAPYATLDLRMDYLRPAGPEADVHCDAHCFRLTRNVAFVRGEVYQADREQPIAVAQASFMLSTPGGKRPTADAAADPSPRPEAEDSAWQPPDGSEPVLAGTTIPYVEYLGIRAASQAEPPLFRLPYQEKLIGNPHLPALHGGVIAGFCGDGGHAAPDPHAARRQVPEEHRLLDRLPAQRPSGGELRRLRGGARRLARGAGAGALLAEGPGAADRRGPRPLPAHGRGRGLKTPQTLTRPCSIRLLAVSTIVCSGGRATQPSTSRRMAAGRCGARRRAR